MHRLAVPLRPIVPQLRGPARNLGAAFPRLLLVLLLFVLVSCVPRAAQGPSPPRPVPPSPGRSVALPIPEDRERRTSELLDGLRDALIRGDTERASRLVSGGDLLSSSARRLIEVLGSRELKFRIEPLAPAGEGLFVRLIVIKGLVPIPGMGLTAFAGPEEGEWRLFPGGPKNSSRATLVEEQMRIRIDPTAGTLAGAAELTVLHENERWIPLELDAADPDDPDAPGFQVIGVEVEGRPARFQVVHLAGALVVELPEERKSDSIRLRIAWEGSPVVRFNFIRAEELFLHEADPWFPVLPSTDAEFDVVLESPDSFELMAEDFSRPGASRPSGKGWRESRLRFRSDRGTTLFGASRYVTETLDLDGIPARIAVHPGRASRLPDLVEGLRATHAALKILGALPSKDLRIVQCTTPDAIAAVGGRSFLGLGRTGMDRKVLAHELAHSWFGGTIPSTLKGEWGGQWPESLAEYVVTWTLPDADAREVRREWSACYSADMGQEGPLRTARNVAGPERPLLYCKGPLVLAGLERRIGRGAMREAFAAFMRRRAGRPSSWEDVVAAVARAAGEEHAAWLRTRLAREHAPSFSLEEIELQGDTVTAVLVQRIAWNTKDLTEELEVVLAGANGVALSEPHLVEVNGRRTVLALPFIKGATGILVDPEYRVPRKYPNGGSGPFPIPASE